MNANWYEYTIIKLTKFVNRISVVAVTRTGTTWTTQDNLNPTCSGAKSTVHHWRILVLYN